MANLQKHTGKAVIAILRHNNRDTLKPSNRDIDPTRSHLNYRLSPKRLIRDGQRLCSQSDYECYKKRLSEVYAFNRKNLVKIASWVISAPRNLEVEKHEVFFRECYNFLENRYGKQNTVQAIVHNDESQPHLHYIFMPVVKDKKHKKPSGEKLCANDVLTRQELREFHPALQEHLNRAGINTRILNGATADGNRTVAEIKKEREHAQNQEKTRGVFLER
ncbi:MAG: plasmid recombination protein [Oscillospiraceae bacterium]|nr:plasmid recombination protein [Oscillospiraceae bacterium]